MARLAEPVTLSKEQKEALRMLVSRCTTARGLARRAGIVLASAEGLLAV